MASYNSYAVHGDKMRNNAEMNCFIFTFLVFGWLAGWREKFHCSSICIAARGLVVIADPLATGVPSASASLRRKTKSPTLAAALTFFCY